MSLKSKVFASMASLALLAGAGVTLAAVGPASAGVAGSRATNANVNPVAGYIAVPDEPNVDLDHVQAYVGAQDKIGDLATGAAALTNAVGVGMCASNGGGSTGPVVETGIVQVSPGVYQEVVGAGITSPLPGSSTGGDNCENGALGNFFTTPGETPTAAPSLCPDADAISGVYAGKNGPILICTEGPTFAFGQVMESNLQFLNGKLLFSVRNITDDNPGVWYTQGWENITSYVGTGVKFDEAIVGADADTTGLVGPAGPTLFPWAHATISSYTYHGHKGSSSFFDTSPYWTAIPVSSYPDGNSGDASVLAGNGLHNGNGQVLEGSPVG